MGSQTTPALRVDIRGDVTSFRYPHFTQGFQPTYDMPPPSTIYGHLTAVLGRYLTRDELAAVRFGYSFRHRSKFVDYMEHLHFDNPIDIFPFDRELLFDFHLTLYLAGIDLDMLEVAFNEPYFTPVLGRSQDLVSYEAVQRVELQPAQQGYFDHTLLPMWMAPRLSRDVIVVTMARYIDPRRQVQWQPYALLRDTERWPPQARTSSRPARPGGRTERGPVEENLVFESDTREIDLLVDPDSPPYRRNEDTYRAVVLHGFTEEGAFATA